MAWHLAFKATPITGKLMDDLTIKILCHKGRQQPKHLLFSGQLKYVSPFETHFQPAQKIISYNGITSSACLFNLMKSQTRHKSLQQPYYFTELFRTKDSGTFSHNSLIILVECIHMHSLGKASEKLNTGFALKVYSACQNAYAFPIPDDCIWEGEFS